MRDKTNYSETFTGKVTVCPPDRTGALAKEAAKTHAAAVRAMKTTSYTELRMREAENRGIGDIESERMMLHGTL